MSTARTVATAWPAWRGELSFFRLSVAAAMHLLAVAALFTAGTIELVWFAITTYVTLQFGLVLGYHRLFSHRCFTTHRWIKRTFALLGTLAMQSGPVTWAAMHRVHHRVADHESDPHTPHHGVTWAHFFWTFFDHPELGRAETRQYLARDLWEDPFIRFCEERFNWVNAAGVAVVACSGFAYGGWPKALSFTLWLIAVRVVCLWHITFLTNSMGHTLGYRNYDTPDDSRNVVLLGVLALGDGWHNNHHAFPACAAHGRRWFELDVTYALIRAMEKTGLARDVRHPRPPAAAGAAERYDDELQ